MISINPDLVPQLESELRNGFQRNRREAEVDAKKIGKENRKRHKSINGVGQLIARIPIDAFHFWGNKLGYECWNDQDFMDEFLRDNPDLRVNSGGTKDIHVGWTPSIK